MSVHLPAKHDRDAWQLAVWNADDAVLTRPQKLELMQTLEAGFSASDPFGAVGDFLRHRDLWRSVLMSRGFPFNDPSRPGLSYLHADLILLRDMPQGHWNVDTVYLLHHPSHTAAPTRLAGGWRADEVGAYTGDDACHLLGAYTDHPPAILRVWWD